MGLFNRLFTKKDNGVVSIHSCVKGRTFDLCDAKCKDFENGKLGMGIAIRPTEGKIYAPEDGTVALMFDTGNALEFKTAGGCDLFISIGIDTIELGGEGFKILKKTDDVVKKGEVLVEFDMGLLSDRKYQDTVLVSILNSEEFYDIRDFTDKEVDPSSVILEMRRNS